MKKIFKEPRLFSAVLFLIAFIVIWSVWYFRYPYFLVWMEGYSYWSDLPDYTNIAIDLPRDWAEYIGAFLLQFYRWPAVAATIQTLLDISFVICIYGIIRRLFKDGDKLIWIAFLLPPFFIIKHISDLQLSYVITYISIGMLCMAVVYLGTIKRRKFIPIPKFLGNIWLSVSVVLISLCMTVSMMLKFGDRLVEDDIAHLEYLMKQEKWNEILEEVSSDDAVGDPDKRKYALLALSETGQLPANAFKYGLASINDFIYPKIEIAPNHLYFIALFYKKLGIYNYHILQIYQMTLQSVGGLSFNALRELADIYLELKDYRLAKKYIDILSHSTCHRKWIRERMPKLEEIKDAEPEYTYVGPDFYLSSFFKEMSAMYDRHPDNHKCAHFMLCGILAEKGLSLFYDAFQIVEKNLYPEGTVISRLYQEALLIYGTRHPEILENYLFEEEVWNRFVDFTSLVEQGKSAQAKSKYPDTYWAYIN